MIKKILIAAVVLVALMVLWPIYRNHSAGVALERYKAKLRAKGEKLTLTELAIPPSTNKEEVLSREIFATNAYPQSLPPQSTLMEYIAEGKARVAWRGKLRCYPPGVSKTNTPVIWDWKAFDQTNSMLAVSLDRFKDALQHPTPDNGWIYQEKLQNILSFPRTLKRDRYVAQALGNAEIGELHRGNLSASVSDLHALSGLARLDRNEPTLVHQMIRVAVARLGIIATWELLQSPGLDDGRLGALQKDWDSVNLIEALERGLQGERAAYQLMVGEMRQDFVKASNTTRTNENILPKLFLKVLQMAYKVLRARTRMNPGCLNTKATKLK